ncbi:MAG: hypothetical protein ILP23_08080 [Paludibacteraceae bacterium]|nr:hypothetical protein [Paludibacteraceae bacterium]
MKKLFYLMVTAFTVFTLTSASKCSNDDDKDAQADKIMYQGFTYKVENLESSVLLTGTGDVAGTTTMEYIYFEGELEKVKFTVKIDCGSPVTAGIVKSYWAKRIGSFDGAVVTIDGNVINGTYTIEDPSSVKELEHERSLTKDGLYYELKETFEKVAPDFGGREA